MELLVQYLRVNSTLVEQIDGGKVMQVACQTHLKGLGPTMSVHQIASVFWLSRNLGPYWDKDLISSYEERLVELMMEEIKVQKRLERDMDADVPEGLQTMNLSDV